MNAPYFNTKNLPNTPGSLEWLKAVSAEETRCCSDIDARRNKLNNEYMTLSEQLGELEKIKDDTYGFFACWRLRIKMKRLARELQWRRIVLRELTNARIARTYGG